MQLTLTCCSSCLRMLQHFTVSQHVLTFFKSRRLQPAAGRASARERRGIVGRRADAFVAGSIANAFLDELAHHRASRHRKKEVRHLKALALPCLALPCLALPCLALP